MNDSSRKTILYSLLIFISFNIVAKNQETRIYKYKSEKGVVSFSGIEPINMDYEIIRIGCYACQVDSTVDWYHAKLYINKYRQVIRNSARLYHVDPAFIRAIIHAESHFNANAISKQGAQGLMQLMPDTAKSLGVNNSFIAQQNINGGVKHLAVLLKKYQGNIRLVAAAYNAGEGAVKKYNGIPPFPETEVYVKRVEILHSRYKKLIRL